MSDLALHKGPLTGLFPTPKTEADWRQYALTEDQVARFERDGFLHDVPILTPHQVAALRSELTELQDPAHEGSEFFYEYHSNESPREGSVLFHALGAWRVRPAFHDVLWNPAFLMAAYQLLGSGFRLFHDQLFAKPAHHGGVVAWHQDYAYWTWTEPMAHLTCWMALDDVSEENGCVTYVPGSHRWGLTQRPQLAGDDEGQMEAIAKSLEPGQLADFERRVPIEMRAGYASFHHPLLVHGSQANRSSRPRRATLINVFADGVRSSRTSQTAPGTKSYPSIPPGEPMGGPYYPLLLDPEGELRRVLAGVPTVKGNPDQLLNRG